MHLVVVSRYHISSSSKSAAHPCDRLGPESIEPGHSNVLVQAERADAEHPSRTRVVLFCTPARSNLTSLLLQRRLELLKENSTAAIRRVGHPF